MKYFVEIGDNDIEVQLLEEGGETFIQFGDLRYPVNVHRTGNGFVTLIMNGRQFDLHIENRSEELTVDTGKGKFVAAIRTEQEKKLEELMAAGAGKGKLSDLAAPMPGLIVEVQVEPGQEFKKGDGLIIIEAMKMENELKAINDGKVKDIKVKAGQAVEKGTCLITFEQ
jgi:acetyl/propionyl-CoA carboxylase alpha subunit